MDDRVTRSFEARLAAQRRVLQWILTKIVASSSEYEEMMIDLNETYPPLDGQEDPGAVVTEAFGETAAFAAEVRAILAPVKARRPERSVR